jgi:signal transduction histidine kinase/CheY-like chemotaxis protein
MTGAILSLAIRSERDVVLARQRARQIAAVVGFDAQDQTRLATAVSEIARNAFAYASGGRVDFRLEGTTPPQILVVRVSDDGPGIANLQTILDGQYRSRTGMGVGILGSRRLVDHCEITSSPRGTTVQLKRLLPRRAAFVDSTGLSRIAEDLARQSPSDPFEEVQRQNQELLRALDELGRRQEDLERLNRELEDTNRGVVALYAELDEKADHLRRADELKSRFLSNMSHEFRTPVNSIQALARMMLDRIDGDLTPDQERQVNFIRKAADALSELVNDLLDLAKVEAGKIEIRPIHFDVGHLFGALRGMLRPLLVNDSVTLVFDEPEDLPTLHSDEAKVSQILRNFISNALKFTEQGEVRVRAEFVPAENAVVFSVADSGIGIAPEDQERIFQEFTQIDSPIQRRVQGTGLGLPLCRKLAELLGGSVRVDSRPGVGSTFRATIPAIFAPSSMREWEVDPHRAALLVVDDSAEAAFLYEKMLDGAHFQTLCARNLREAHDALASFRPRAIILDILLRGEDSWAFLTELKRRPETASIPILVVTTVDDEAKARALGADAFFLKPVDRPRLQQTILDLVAPPGLKRVLLVDDEEVFRYVLRQHLTTAQHRISEAATGSDALRLARSERPDVICLDLGMPDLDGVEVLRALRADPGTRDIPVLIVTSRALDEAERQSLREFGADVLQKAAMSRESALEAIESAMRIGGKAA